MNRQPLPADDDLIPHPEPLTPRQEWILDALGFEVQEYLFAKNAADLVAFASTPAPAYESREWRLPGTAPADVPLILDVIDGDPDAPARLLTEEDLS